MFTVTFSWLLLIALIAGVLALVDGIIRVRGRGTAILAVIEIVVAALFLLSLFVSGIPFGSLVLAIALLIVLLIQLFAGGRRRAGLPLTIIAIVLLAIWIVLDQGWLVIPGIN